MLQVQMSNLLDFFSLLIGGEGFSSASTALSG
jgi:hypothetical protein